MLPAQTAELTSAAPSGVDEALDLVAVFDRALENGLGRPGAEQTRALADLAGAMAATPLGALVREAADAIGSGTIGDAQTAALAGARSALIGAVHDALLAAADTALGRTRDADPEPDEPAEAPTGPLGGVRSWLTELAVIGWRGVDRDIAGGADQAIEALLGDPERRRAAVLLDGLAAELQANAPVAAMEGLPTRRWADLWARAVLLTQDAAQAGPSGTAAPATGRLLPLGADVHEHGTAVQLQVHAIFEPADGGPARLVRAAVSAPKVDVIVGPGVWNLLTDHQVLLGALADKRSVKIEGMPLLDGGDLIWQEELAGLDEPADPFSTARVALPVAHAPAVPPLERHPVRIAEPVLLEGYKKGTAADGGPAFDLGDAVLPVDTGRLPGCGPLTEKLVAASSACIGLLRWDAGRWSVQPLAVQTTIKRKPAEVHTADWAMGPTDPKVAKAEARYDAVNVLRERSGRLLRK
ncbi:hypothetical protein [Nocardiopsis potens]|uniref:hypothetical protein n=1 Tax=Nocardiopsis potens TaxID=1246458 RepID=UPI0003492D02|nr:hypothetical protein [Nocardiopsis potens]